MCTTLMSPPAPNQKAVPQMNAFRRISMFQPRSPKNNPPITGDINQKVGRRGAVRLMPFGALLLVAACGTPYYNTSTDSAGYKALDRGDYAAAEQYYAAATLEDPNEPYYLLNLGAAKQRQGNMAEAEPLYRKVISMDEHVSPPTTTTKRSTDNTLSEIACQNLRMGLPPATVAGTARPCQTTEIAAVVPPAVVAPPAPKPQPVARTVIRSDIYFNFDGSSLSPEGREAVRAIANEARDDATIRISLVGKTDLAGTDTYNLALSSRRVRAVQDALIARGVSARRIDIQNVGERQPPIETAQGVRERLNRVVEVVVQ